MRTIRVGLLGLGTVGQSVARALLERKELLSRAVGAPLVLQRTAVRDPTRARALKPEPLGSDVLAVARAEDVDVLVELIGGQTDALAAIEAALGAGKPVVTANKRIVAWHGPRLLALAAKHGAELRYEAAVGGGIPILAPLMDDLAANQILELRAIINGTTNYILTEMAKGIPFTEALLGAQAQGFAEADPTDDVDAIDAADKLAILARLAFGAEVTPEHVFRQGIRALDAKDLAYGRELGYALKLVALARRSPNGIETRVHPAFLPTEHPLARVDGALNAIHVTGDLCGPVMFSGRGAGGDATASSVLADLVHVARRLSLGDPAPQLRDGGPALPIAPLSESRTRCYFRLAVDDVPGVFAQLTQVLAAHHIGLASVIQREPGKQGQAEIVLLTYSAPETQLAAAETELAKLPCTRAVVARIRVDAPDAKGA